MVKGTWSLLVKRQVKLGNRKCVGVKRKDNNGVTTKERGKMIHGTIYLSKN